MTINRTWIVFLAGVAVSGATFVAGRSFADLGRPAKTSTDPETSTMTAMREPTRVSGGDMTCLLSPDQLNAQREQLIPGLFTQAERVEDLSDGLRFHFAHRTGLVTELAGLIERERVCCSFLRFRLVTESGTGPVVLEVTGPQGTAEMLRKL